MKTLIKTIYEYETNSTPKALAWSFAVFMALFLICTQLLHTK